MFLHLSVNEVRQGNVSTPVFHSVYRKRGVMYNSILLAGCVSQHAITRGYDRKCVCDRGCDNGV